MVFDQSLLFITAVSLHTGFGLVLGMLGNNLRFRPGILRGIGSVAGFILLIYFPSCLTILGLHELPRGMRLLALATSMIAVVLPLTSNRPLLETINPGKIWNAYPTVSMLLIAAWSLITFFMDGTVSGAPLAVAATIAALASLQRHYEPQ
jgi:hypothetical protein